MGALIFKNKTKKKQSYKFKMNQTIDKSCGVSGPGFNSFQRCRFLTRFCRMASGFTQPAPEYSLFVREAPV